MSIFNLSIFGGMNQSDSPDVLINRAFQEGEGGFAQFGPAESADIQDMDFDQEGIKTRKGSLIEQDLSSVLVSGDTLVKGIEYVIASDGVKEELIVGKKSIYVKTAGVWQQLNDSAGSAYSHAADVSKVTFATTDGHLFIGINGANQIQVFKGGTDLDPELANGNTYEEAFSATTHTITGTWATGTYLLAVIHNRLVTSDGNTFLEFTPQMHTSSSGIWDLTNGGFFQSTGEIKAMFSFVPFLTDSLKEFLYIGSSNGIEVLEGFAATDKLIRIEGSKPPLNHQSWTKTKNWIVYLTADKNIYGVNGSSIINLGRRMLTPSQEGILNEMNVVQSVITSFAFYNSKKEQAQFYFTTAEGKFNDLCILIDFQLGEPLINEPQSEFEKRVRFIAWRLKSGADDEWFAGSYGQEDEVRSFLRDGKIFNQEKVYSDIAFNQNVSEVTLTGTDTVKITVTGHNYVTGTNVMFRNLAGTTEVNGNTYIITVVDDDDFTLDGTIASNFTAYTSGGTAQAGREIDSYYFTPQFAAGSAKSFLKQWNTLEMRTKSVGGWLMTLDTYLNRSIATSQTDNYKQIKRDDASFDDGNFDVSLFSDGQSTRQRDRASLRSEVIQYRFKPEGPSSPFTLQSLSLNYQLGNSVIN